jgi:tetratricopeptide (TPR) repeat protein
MALARVVPESAMPGLLLREGTEALPDLTSWHQAMERLIALLPRPHRDLLAALAWVRGPVPTEWLPALLGTTGPGSAPADLLTLERHGWVQVHPPREGKPHVAVPVWLRHAMLRAMPEAPDQRLRRLALLFREPAGWVSEADRAWPRLAAWRESLTEDDPVAVTARITMTLPALATLPAALQHTWLETSQRWYRSLPEGARDVALGARLWEARAAHAQQSGDPAMARALAEAGLGEVPAGDPRAATLHARLAFVCRQLGETDAALQHGAHATALAPALSDWETAARCAGAVASIHLEQGHDDEAVEMLDRGLAAARWGGLRRAEINLLIQRAVALRCLGRIDDALATLDTAGLLASPQPHPIQEAVLAGVHAGILMTAERTADALIAWQDAVRRSEALGLHRSAALFRPAQAGTLAALGRWEEARALLEKPTVEGPVFLRVHQLWTWMVDACTCVHTGGGDEARLMLALLQSRRASLDTGEAPGHGLRSDEVRLAESQLDIWMDRLREHADGLGMPPSLRLAHGAPAGDPAIRHAVLVERDYTAFQAPGSPPADLSRRPVLRRMLEVLVTAHAATPGAWLSTDDLFARVWPGERCQGPATRHRVRAQIWLLRRLGMGEALEGGRGYRLAPDVCLMQTQFDADLMPPGE